MPSFIKPLSTIVIADDDAAVRRILETIAKQNGYTCVGVAEKGEQAVGLVRQFKPDLILLDIHLPDMDGLKATEQIMTLGGTAVVLLTGDPNPELAHRAMGLGATGYSLKPFEATSLIAMMESAWHRFQEIRDLKAEVLQLNETLETRKLIEKAKGILMEQQGFTEEAAHKMLQKMSQDQGISLKEVCRAVVQVRMVLGKSTQRKAL